MNKFQLISENLLNLVEKTVPKLKDLDAQTAAHKPEDSMWSIKEILGHLLDSAVNNHHRFINAQQVNEYQIKTYDQLFWVTSQKHNDTPWHELIDLWQLYNQHLARAIRLIPAEKETMPCHLTESEIISFGFLVGDYVHHMEHHLKQIEERNI